MFDILYAYPEHPQQDGLGGVRELELSSAVGPVALLASAYAATARSAGNKSVRAQS